VDCGWPRHHPGMILQFNSECSYPWPPRGPLQCTGKWSVGWKAYWNTRCGGHCWWMDKWSCIYWI